jgi:low affinity Fe/Cu permease
MASKKSNSKKAAAAVAHQALAPRKHSGGNKSRTADKKGHWSDMFSNMACAAAHWMGKPIAFLVALLAVIIWAATGPIFQYSDTWQLVINTSTTIVTFLMVFLIQNTQNRDTMAVQLKLSELILKIDEAENRFATAEDMSEEQLEELHAELRQQAEDALGQLNTRRAAREKKAS